MQQSSQHPMGNSTDGIAVRPGTSDALTARTIDATIHPPLVRAQETVVALVPRVTDAVAPLTSPLFLGAILLTLVFTWVAIRLRYKPSALVLGVLLVMGLTSFRPMPKPESKRVVAARTPRTTLGGTRPAYKNRDYEPRNRDYQPPQPVEPPDVYVHVDPVQGYLPPELAEHVSDWSRDAMRSAEQMMRDNEHMREMMRQLRYRLREEARRERWRQMAANRRRIVEFDLDNSP
jgi:hypothetical protein